jgi:hypothetical protein
VVLRIESSRICRTAHSLEHFKGVADLGVGGKTSMRYKTNGSAKMTDRATV